MRLPRPELGGNTPNKLQVVRIARCPLIKQLRAIRLEVIPNANFLPNPEHRELYLSGLRLAMGEAG